MPTYLNPESAHQSLIDLQLIGADEPAAKTIAVIEDLQCAIDAWLGYNACINEYSEQLNTGISGSCVTSDYPIVELLSAEIKRPHLPISTLALDAIWNGNSRTLDTGLREVSIAVTYTAGLEPVPKIFALTMLGLLRRSCIAGTVNLDTSWINESTKSITSIALPGGLKKTFANSPSPASGGTPATELDKALSPLLPYRRSGIGLN